MKVFKSICIFLLLFNSVNSYSQSTIPKTGNASFYEDAFNGRRTASGEIFSQKKLTCAHISLPFGTKLKVTNLQNDKTVTVTVNDRGPFVRGRIIDLSKAAAKKLEFLGEGETKVSIEILSSEGSGDTLYSTHDSLSRFYKIEALDSGLKGYSIKIASYYSQDKAFEVVRELKQELARDVFIQTTVKKKQLMYRIFAGRFATKKDAEDLREKLIPYYSDCYVVEFYSTQ